ncbi:MAG: S8 family serine peptidase [Jaaginema sp. PMC 1079.18]|nr:S8 family serine peptidase [Jaaginema sp. PMC 1080.18]MEC4853162.1 S8 family serine peptidase [Jaaginema sp. PMC 1079.18]MEC4866916.1 S8 family serine peptidase [Jaaginema sp. PMC 1078.18]
MKKPSRQRQQQPTPSFNTFILEPILTPSGLVDAPGDDTPDPSLLSDLFNDLDGDDLTDTPEDLDSDFPEELTPVSFFDSEPPESPFNAGVFTVDDSGQVGIDFLYDGGGYKGELAIFSLEGMEDLEPGSEAFIEEAARRALTNSTEGHIVIQDATEGAKFEGRTSWESNFNSGDYKGVKTVEMNPGETFGVMLVPRGTVQQVYDNPDIGGATRPLFSMQTINPNDAFHVGQIADVTGDGNTFVMEDLRTDGFTDQDYNDIIFQVRGATAEATHIDDVIDADRDWRFNDTGKALIEYAKAYVEPSSEAFEAPDVPVAHQPLVGFIDTGLNEGNPDLDYDNITLGRDLVDGDSNSLLASGEGNEHGTHIAGIVAAQSDNNIGIDGINEDAPLWVGRAVGSGKWSESLIEFVDAAKDSGQPNAVVNLSMDLIQIDADGNETTRYELTPTEREAIEYARQHNVLIVASAGNDGGVMSALGQASQEFDNIITVGAAEQFDLLKSSWQGADRADYSSYGYGLDIMAYGGTPDNPEISLTEDNVGTLAGTSIATAKVTGAVSQVWAANPDLNYRQVIELLKKTATDLGDTDFDTETGAGLLNIAAAIHLAKTIPGETYNPTPWYAPDTWSGAGKVTASDRAANNNNISGSPTSTIPTDKGTFLRTENSNGVTIHYYMKGYLMVQPSGYTTWYAQGTGQPVGRALNTTPQLRTASSSSHPTDQIYQRINNTWQQVRGSAKDIAVGADGSVWVIGTDVGSGGYGIYKRNGTRWDKVDGSATQIAVDPDGNPWVVNSVGKIYKRENNRWREMPGSAKDIAIGADGSVWVIGTNKARGGYGIFKWTGTRWQEVGGRAVRITVDPNGNPWVVNSTDKIYQRVNNRWIERRGAAKDIEVGADGSVWVVGTNPVHGGYGIYKWENSGWTGISGGAVRIAVDPNGNPWVVNGRSEQKYYPELTSLSADNWDIQSGDDNQFRSDSPFGGGNQMWKTSDTVRQVYTDLSKAIFGSRVHMNTGYAYDQGYYNYYGKWHAGIDMGAPAGTPIKAVVGGTVSWVNHNFMGIDSDDGNHWVYGHLGNKYVSRGQRIEVGRTLAVLDSANHLHLEVQHGHGYKRTNGAHPDRNYVRSVTMSPLQAYWKLRNR